MEGIHLDYAKKICKRMLDEKQKDLEVLALTVTFRSLHSKSPEGQLKETLPALTLLLHRSCYFDIYPEYRITTGDIHYHCMIRIFDKIKWLKSTLPSLKGLGFILVKKIDDLEKWTSYCLKEVDIIRGIVGSKLEVPITRHVKLVKVKSKRLKEWSISEWYENVEKEIETEEEEIKCTGSS